MLNVAAQSLTVAVVRTLVRSLLEESPTMLKDGQRVLDRAGTVGASARAEEEFQQGNRVGPTSNSAPIGALEATTVVLITTILLALETSTVSLEATMMVKVQTMIVTMTVSLMVSARCTGTDPSKALGSLHKAPACPGTLVENALESHLSVKNAATDARI